VQLAGQVLALFLAHRQQPVGEALLAVDGAGEAVGQVVEALGDAVELDQREARHARLQVALLHPLKGAEDRLDGARALRTGRYTKKLKSRIIVLTATRLAIFRASSSTSRP
jgi:hypothetical protein